MQGKRFAYLLRCRLTEQLPTIFAIGDTIIFFHKTGAYFASPIGPPELLSYDAAAAPDVLVWALIDRMMNTTELLSWLISTEVFPVQTSLPNSLLYKSWSEIRLFPAGTSHLSHFSRRKGSPVSTP